jgi:hypothetical protein
VATPLPAPQSDYSLIKPPSYDGIVGGVAPSPFASFLLLAGAVIVVIAAVATAMNTDSTEWWQLGGILVATALFLAAFVSRSA